MSGPGRQLNAGPFGPLLRGTVVWLAIIVGESVNGTVRELFITPRLGDFRARRVGFAIALVLISLITFFSIKWIRARSYPQTMIIGLVWVILMFCFEVSLGRFAAGFSWDRIAQDYDVTRGGLMFFGLAYLALAPTIAYRIRR